MTLAWGCLGIFFAFPFIMMSIHLSRGSAQPGFAQEFKYIGEYMRTTAAVIISLAGFNTAEVFKK